MKSEKEKRRDTANCETCEYYFSYDDTEEESCRAALDEDEMYRSMHGKCPYYRRYDEYRTVRKQI